LRLCRLCVRLCLRRRRQVMGVGRIAWQRLRIPCRRRRTWMKSTC